MHSPVRCVNLTRLLETRYGDKAARRYRCEGRQNAHDAARQPKHPVLDRRPAEHVALEALRQKADAGAIPPQQLV